MRYARKCTATSQGMNQGFVTNDGESYFKYKRDLIVHLREYEWEFRDTLEKLIDTNDLTDDEFLEYCYNDDAYYYTEWEDEDDYEWEEINGELIEIPGDLAFARIQQEHQRFNMKYVVVDTWNGEGYSSENGVDLRFFLTKAEAEIVAEQGASRYENLERYVDDKAISFGYDIDDDNGSYQVLELKDDTYAIMIRTNVNEVDLLSEAEYKSKIQEFESEDLDASPNGDVFIGGVDDYDYQFRLLQNTLI